MAFLNPILLKLAPYAIGVALLFAGYKYVTNLQKQNQTLKQNNITLKHNEEQIVKAYENSITILEKKSYNEGMNKAASLVSKDLAKKITKLNKERKFDEINNSTYRTTSF